MNHKDGRHLDDFVKYEEYLCPCESCILSNIQKLSSLQNGDAIDNTLDDHCETCNNWEFKDATFVHRDNEYQSLDEIYEDGHDVRDSTGNYVHSIHMKLTFEKLKKYSTRICTDIVNECMFFSRAKMIFDRLGINEALQLNFKNQCSVIIEERIEKDMEELITYEDMGNIIRFPPSWNGVFPLENHVPVPMHALFLGGVKSMLSLMKIFFTGRKSLPDFSDVVQTSVNQVCAMHLSWLKLLPYHPKGEFGSYVSENYLGISRVQRWFYLHMKDIPGMFESNYNFPNDGKIIQQRYCPELQKWLVSRDISIYNIDGDPHRKPSLVQLVTRFINNPSDIQEYIEGTSRLSSVSEMEALIISMSSFLSRVMSKVKSKSVNQREELLLNVKVLLYHFNKIDSKMHPNNKNDTIVTRRYNLQTYLLYPEVEYLYGHIRHIWEGGKDGEAFIQDIKRHMHNGIVGNFSHNAIMSLFMDEFFNSFGVITTEAAITKKFVTYKSITDVTNILQENKPLSLVIIRHGLDSFLILACISNKRNRDGVVITKGIEVKVHLEQEIITQLGQQFFDLELVHEDEIHFNDDSVMCYGIALPFHNKYTLITSEWQQVVQVATSNDNDEMSWNLELCHYKI